MTKLILEFFTPCIFISVSLGLTSCSTGHLEETTKDTEQVTPQIKQSFQQTESLQEKRKLAYHEARKMCQQGKRKTNETIKYCIKRLIKESAN